MLKIINLAVGGFCLANGMIAFGIGDLTHASVLLILAGLNLYLGVTSE